MKQWICSWVLRPHSIARRAKRFVAAATVSKPAAFVWTCIAVSTAGALTGPALFERPGHSGLGGASLSGAANIPQGEYGYTSPLGNGFLPFTQPSSPVQPSGASQPYGANGPIGPITEANASHYGARAMPVPEPSSLWLLAPALAAFHLWRIK